ncbi:sialin-like [Bradysia coprophila]|uniref:sialin-like n=1 Tax=Bradysia coprophila TaxID=38358 RepID=UPI00187DA0A2|nr:sialin-like [Bradysia coprophila]
MTTINIFDKIPSRLMTGVMIFFATFFSYMLRNAMSINILAMVKPTNLNENENGTITDPPNYGPERLDWSAYQQSLLLGSFFWGYAITPLPSGVLSDKFGGRRLVGYSFLISCILEAVTPVASASFWVSFMVRFLIGFFSGTLYPALHKLVSKWAPPEEKGKFVSALVGGAIGTVVTWSVAGYLVESVGWDYAFYVPAILSGCFTIVWFITTFDDPASHPRISTEEKEYIENSLLGVTYTKRWPPLVHVFKSIPFWALLILHYGNLWGLYFLMTAAPKYMNEVLGFNLSKSGILASLPYLARFFAGFIFGSIGDLIRKKQWFEVTTIRKSFCLFSHIIPGLFLIALPYVNERPAVCVAFVTLSLGFNGAGTMTNLQNSQDLAPNYAGTVYGIINSIGTTAGFITPLIVAHYTQERSTIDEWSSVFLIGAIAYIAPAILFIIFGSGKIQYWNDLDLPKTDDHKSEEESSTKRKN